jgi:hypothetical protein
LSRTFLPPLQLFPPNKGKAAFHSGPNIQKPFASGSQFSSIHPGKDAFHSVPNIPFDQAEEAESFK